jgi:hypothetical protein
MVSELQRSFTKLAARLRYPLGICVYAEQRSALKSAHGPLLKTTADLPSPHDRPAKNTTPDSRCKLAAVLRSGSVLSYNALELRAAFGAIVSLRSVGHTAHADFSGEDVLLG